MEYAQYIIYVQVNAACGGKKMAQIARIYMESSIKTIGRDFI